MNNIYGSTIDHLPKFRLSLGVWPGVKCGGCGYIFEHVQPRMAVAVHMNGDKQEIVACKKCMSFKIPRDRYNKMKGDL